MKALLQRVKNAKVVVNSRDIANIEGGLLVFLGVGTQDDENDIDWLTKKITNIRIFDDQDHVMNLSINQVDLPIIVVSQFTLLASTKKGNRPSYIDAATPIIAERLYEKFVVVLQSKVKQRIQTGKFGSNMQVELTNDGPVTILLDSKNEN